MTNEEKNTDSDPATDLANAETLAAAIQTEPSGLNADISDPALWYFPWEFPRNGVEGLEGKTDAEHVISWVKMVFTSATETGADVVTHLVMNAIVRRMEENKDKSKGFHLSEFELSLVQWAFLSARLPGAANKMACIMFRKFKLSL